MIIASYPMLDTKIGAAAWGFTWKANCIDAAARASLSKFIGDRMGSRGIAPEGTSCP